MASCSLMPAKKIYVTTEGTDLGTGSKSQPLQSLDAAREAVRKIRLESPDRNIRVLIGEGTWYLTRPLQFGAADGGSGKASVSWEGMPDGKTRISGGKEIGGFRDAGYGIWWANVDSSLRFEQLYVDGIRAVRARTPNLQDSLPRIYLTKSNWVYHPDSSVRNITVQVKDRGYFKDLMPTGDFEMVVFKDWTTSRFHVYGLNADPAEIYLKPPFALFDGSYNSIFAGNADRYSCFLEGDPAFLDQPGEWALSAIDQRVYYKPLPEQQPDRVKVTAPVSSRLILIKGTRENPVQNLGFRNLTLEHSAYLLPEFNCDGMQAAFYYPGNTPATGGAGLINPAVELEWADHCSLENCRVQYIGGNGIYLGAGARDNRILLTSVVDVGGNGIMIGLTYDPKEDTLILPVNNTISGGSVSRAGAAFQGSVGIWLGFGAGNEISNCEVYDLPYTGISLGWQWNPLPTSSRNNRILNNRIHHVMQVLGDGGGIYTLGYQPGSLIKGNDIHDILRSELNHASDNNGMFIDEGSKGYTIEENTISNTAHTNIRGHRAAGVELTRNTFHSGNLAAVSHTPPYDAMIYVNKDTTVTWKNPGWPREWGYGDSVTAFTLHDI